MRRVRRGKQMIEISSGGSTASSGRTAAVFDMFYGTSAAVWMDGMDKGAFDGLPFVGFNDDDVGERER